MIPSLLVKVTLADSLDMFIVNTPTENRTKSDQSEKDNVGQGQSIQNNTVRFHGTSQVQRATRRFGWNTLTQVFELPELRRDRSARIGELYRKILCDCDERVAPNRGSGKR